MATSGRRVVQNQVFIGLPWKNVRPKYERIISRLEKKYAVHFTIVGRGDSQKADDLLSRIKSRLESSSYAVFDATGGNANVSLEFGYAEGIGLEMALYVSTHKSAQRSSSGSPIISDLAGKNRVQYKTEKNLRTNLEKLCKDHPYTSRFEKALTNAVSKKDKGGKKRARALALKIVHMIDDKPFMRRADLVQKISAMGYSEDEVDELIRKLHSQGVINCSVGNQSRVEIQ